jgi:predicted phage terminase large subunit-like protein
MPAVGATVALAALEARAAAVNKPPQAPYNGSYADFIAEVCPDYPLTANNLRLISILQRVADGELKRLMLFLPPRHYKSTTVSRLFPAYWLRRNPRQYVGLGSYGATLAEGFSRAARGYYVSSGGVLDRSSASVNQWATGARGGMWAVGVDGAGSGLGYDLGIIDDPHKNRLEAESPTYRQRVKDWIDAVFMTRQEPTAAVVLLMTRWHVDDAAGYLLEKERQMIAAGEQDLAEQWHIVSMPAIAPDDTTSILFPPTCTVEHDNRQPGEALDPERIPLKKLQQFRATLISRDWESLYQQSPKIVSGAVFFRDWFRYWAPAGKGQPGDQEQHKGFIRTILSVDAAFKDTTNSDHVALLLWGQADAGMFLLHIINQRLSFTATVATITQLYAQRPFSELLVEDKANGAAVIDTLKQQARGYAIREVNPLGGKIPRANASTLQWEQGRVFLPRLHPQLKAFEDQHLAFPSTDKDDMVDATSQLLNYVAGTGPMRVSTVSYGLGGAAPERPMPADERWARNRGII